jgi:hypothetical protein
VQFTVRLPRWLATTLAIVIASVAVAALLPAIAASDSPIIKVCIDPASNDLTVNPTCTGSTISWNQQGVAGTNGAAGATGATGATGPAGAPGPALHLAKSKPGLEAKIEAALAVQSATLTDINHDLRTSAAITTKLTPSSDPTLAAVQTGLNVQAAQLARIVNVLRSLTKAQGLLLQGIE